MQMEEAYFLNKCKTSSFNSSDYPTNNVGIVVKKQTKHEPGKNNVTWTKIGNLATMYKYSYLMQAT